MAEEESTCSFVNPVTGDGCQFERLAGKDIYHAHHDGRRFCWWHLPYGEARNAIMRDPHKNEAYHRILPGWLDRWGSRGEPVDLSGMTFDSIPAEYLRFTESPLVLHGSKILKDLLLERAHLLSVEIGSTTVFGDVVIRVRLKEGLRIRNSRIEGSVICEGPTSGSLSASETRVLGQLVASNVALNELELSRSVVHSGLKVSTKRNLRLRIQRLVLVGDCQIKAGGSADVEADGLSIRADPNAKSFVSCGDDGRTSQITFQGCRLRGWLFVRGKWSRLDVNHSVVDDLRLQSSQTNAVSARDSTFSTFGGSGPNVDVANVSIKRCVAEDISFIATTLGEFHLGDTRAGGVALLDATFIRGVFLDGDNRLEHFNVSSTRESSSRLPGLHIECGFVNASYFNSRRVTGEARFENVTFGRAPQFFGAKFDQSVSFPAQERAYVSARRDDADAYRCLRHIMEEKRNRDLEGVFFALEKKCALDGMPPWSPDAVFSRLYKWTSNYGNSIGRPLIWLVAVVAIAALWYSIALQLAHPGIADLPVARGAVMSLRQTFAPFFQIREAGWGLGWYLGWTTQSVISIGLIAELLVTIRWRFRRG